MNRTFSANAILSGLCAGAVLASAVAASAATQVTFQVDMTEQIIGGTFVPGGTSTVSAHGTFNSWGAGLNLTNNPAAANSNLYTGTLLDTGDANGNVLIYKYVMNSTWESTQDGQNRCAQLPAGGGSLVLPVSFFDDAGPQATANVTFQVDMAEQVNLGNFDTNTGSYVEVRGSFNSWSGGNTLTNDPTILTTNSTGTVASNVYVGTFAVTGPTNGTEEYKYVTQPNTVYESPNANDSDYDNSENRFFIVTTEALPIVSFDDVPLSITVTNNVTFVVDMSVQAALGNFAVPANTVEIHGSFNSWSGGITMTNSPSDPDTNHYYTTMTLIGGAGTPGTFFQYVIQPETEWESAVGNRTLYLGDQSGNLTNGLNPAVYWNNEGPSTLLDIVDVTNCMVTFTVDMTPAIDLSVDPALNFTPGVDSVYLNGIQNGVDGSWATWNETALASYEMTEVTNGPLYTITVPVNFGQPLNVVYKYSIDGSDNEAGQNDNHSRYIRSLPDYTMPTDVFGSQGTSPSSEISFGDFAVARTNDQVALSWLGRTGVSLETTPSLATTPVVWTRLPLTDGTNLLVAPGSGLARTNFTIGNGALFFRLIGPQ